MHDLPYLEGKGANQDEGAVKPPGYFNHLVRNNQTASKASKAYDSGVADYLSPDYQNTRTE